MYSTNQQVYGNFQTGIYPGQNYGAPTPINTTGQPLIFAQPQYVQPQYVQPQYVQPIIQPVVESPPVQPIVIHKTEYVRPSYYHRPPPIIIHHPPIFRPHGHYYRHHYRKFLI